MLFGGVWVAWGWWLLFVYWNGGRDGVLRVLCDELASEVVITGKRAVLGSVELDPPFDPGEWFSVRAGELVYLGNQATVTVVSGGRHYGCWRDGEWRVLGDEEVVRRFVREAVRVKEEVVTWVRGL